jgi:hypothetical protein
LPPAGLWKSDYGDIKICFFLRALSGFLSKNIFPFQKIVDGGGITPRSRMPSRLKSRKRTNGERAFSEDSALLKKAPSHAIFPQNPQSPRNLQARQPEKAYPAARYGNHLLIRHLLHLLDGLR